MAVPKVILVTLVLGLITFATAEQPCIDRPCDWWETHYGELDKREEFDDALVNDRGCSYGYILHDGMCMECPPGTHPNKAATACVDAVGHDGRSSSYNIGGGGYGGGSGGGYGFGKHDAHGEEDD